MATLPKVSKVHKESLTVSRRIGNIKPLFHPTAPPPGAGAAAIAVSEQRPLAGDAGMPQGCFRGARSERADAQMSCECSIPRDLPVPEAHLGAGAICRTGHRHALARKATTDWHSTFVAAAHPHGPNAIAACRLRSENAIDSITDSPPS